MKTDKCYHSGSIIFSYGKNKPVLNLPDLKIRKGAVTVITGENGSGKTTLLKILGGLLDTGGTDGKQQLTGIQRESVYLHQSPYLFRGTVARNLKLAYSSKRGFPEEVLKTVGLEGFADRRVNTLSGGETRRVALARVFLSDKPILLLDEPAAHVDEISMKRMEEACRRYAAEGRTVVIASHRGSFSYRVADVIIELASGRRIPGPVNIFKGETGTGDGGHLIFRSGEATFRVPEIDGNHIVALIRGEDIILSLLPLKSSARNCLPGIVKSIDSRDNGLFAVRVDCRVTMTALISASSVKEMKLKPGVPVYATFKASSVVLY